MTPRTQVAIVGAGPAGLALAVELRLGGASVVVLEALPEPSTESRATTLHARTMEAFDERGLVGEFGAPPREPMGHVGGVPLDLGEVDSPYAGQWKVPQAHVERVLAVRAVRLGARIERGHELVALEQDAHGVTLVTTSPGGRCRLRADYVVGCDGENSAVRSLAGFTLTGRAASREMLRADLAGIDIPNRRFERHPRGLAVAARRPDGVTRVMVHEFGSTVTGAGAPTLDAVAGAWLRVVGEDVRHGTPLWLNRFDDTSRQVDQYRRGRVLLAGDAAHQQLPVGGQALNLAVQDSFNLGWKLAAHVRGSAPPALLDSYHAERHAVGRSILTNIAAQAELLLGGPEVEPLRAVVTELLSLPAARRELAGWISGISVAYPTADGCPGTRIPHLDLMTEAGWRRTSELLYDARGVLLDLSGDPRRTRALRVLGEAWWDRIDVVSAVAPSRLPANRHVLPDTVLIRPDGYLAWTGDRDADPGPALREHFGRPLRAHELREDDLRTDIQPAISRAS